MTRATPATRLVLLVSGWTALVTPPAARAVDGVIEISQARALAGGVDGDLAADPPGFPVRITRRGSYRLTSELAVGSSGTGIEVAADFVTIDFNGFGLRGEPGAVGAGVQADSARHVTVRNGYVTGFAGVGIALGADGRVEAMRVEGCQSGGIEAGPRSLVLGNHVVGNGGPGLALAPSSGYSGNEVALNAPDRQGGRALGANLCGDGTCGSASGRLFFLTPATFTGAQADEPGTCGAGFHLASFWEISALSGLRYDTERGLLRDDSGSGPPGDEEGWVRTGRDRSGTDTPGHGNCQAWSSGAHGTTVKLVKNWNEWNPLMPWDARTFGCGSQRRVWCIED